MSVVLYAGSVERNVTMLALPEPGAFNGSILRCPGRNVYTCVYRADERTFAACDLTLDLSLVTATHERGPVFRVTSPALGRQKSWLPFHAGDALYIVSHINPTPCGESMGSAMAVTLRS